MVLKGGKGGRKNKRCGNVGERIVWGMYRCKHDERIKGTLNKYHVFVFVR